MVMDCLEFRDKCLPIVRNITKKLLLKKHAQISSIKTDGLMNSVLNTFHYPNMTVDTAFLSSDILKIKFC